MSNKPAITVLTAVYNEEKFISKSIESILDQTFEDFEYIIVDDASTDDTFKIAKSYDDDRIKVLRNNKNLGPFGSANRGLDKARGKYIVRLDGDDIALPNRLEVQFSFMQDNPEYDLVGSWYLIIDEMGAVLKERKTPITHPEIFCTNLLGCSMGHSTIIVKRDFLDEIGRYNDKQSKAQDYELYLRAMNNHGKLYNIPKYLVLYRNHGNNITNSFRSAQEEIAIITLKKYLKEILDLEVPLETISKLRQVLREKWRAPAKTKLVALQYMKMVSGNISKGLDAPNAKKVCRSIINNQIKHMLRRDLFKRIANLYIRF